MGAERGRQRGKRRDDREATERGRETRTKARRSRRMRAEVKDEGDSAYLLFSSSILLLSSVPGPTAYASDPIPDFFRSEPDLLLNCNFTMFSFGGLFFIIRDGSQCCIEIRPVSGSARKQGDDEDPTGEEK